VPCTRDALVCLLWRYTRTLQAPAIDDKQHVHCWFQKIVCSIVGPILDISCWTQSAACTAIEMSAPTGMANHDAQNVDSHWKQQSNSHTVHSSEVVRNLQSSGPANNPGLEGWVASPYTNIILRTFRAKWLSRISKFCGWGKRFLRTGSDVGTCSWGHYFSFWISSNLLGSMPRSHSDCDP
jgi:hypothetical protein